MKTALVVIDVQSYFVNEFTRDVPQKIATYLETDKPEHVFFTQFINANDSQFVRRLNWRKCLDSPDTDIHEALRGMAAKKTFAKPGFSIFSSVKLQEKLEKFDALQLCGIDSDACVLASAFEAFDRDFGVEILWDLTASHHGEKSDEAARLIIQKNLSRSEAT